MARGGFGGRDLTLEELDSMAGDRADLRSASALVWPRVLRREEEEEG